MELGLCLPLPFRLARQSARVGREVKPLRDRGMLSHVSRKRYRRARASPGLLSLA